MPSILDKLTEAELEETISNQRSGVKERISENNSQSSIKRVATAVITAVIAVLGGTYCATTSTISQSADTANTDEQLRRIIERCDSLRTSLEEPSVVARCYTEGLQERPFDAGLFQTALVYASQANNPQQLSTLCDIGLRRFTSNPLYQQKCINTASAEVLSLQQCQRYSDEEVHSCVDDIFKTEFRRTQIPFRSTPEQSNAVNRLRQTATEMRQKRDVAIMRAVPRSESECLNVTPESMSICTERVFRSEFDQEGIPYIDTPEHRDVYYRLHSRADDTRIERERQVQEARNAEIQRQREQERLDAARDVANRLRQQADESREANFRTVIARARDRSLQACTQRSRNSIRRCIDRIYTDELRRANITLTEVGRTIRASEQSQVEDAILGERIAVREARQREAEARREEAVREREERAEARRAERERRQAEAEARRAEQQRQREHDAENRRRRRAGLPSLEQEAAQTQARQNEAEARRQTQSRRTVSIQIPGSSDFDGLPDPFIIINGHSYIDQFCLDTTICRFTISEQGPLTIHIFDKDLFGHHDFVETVLCDSGMRCTNGGVTVLVSP